MGFPQLQWTQPFVEHRLSASISEILRRVISIHNMLRETRVTLAHTEKTFLNDQSFVPACLGAVPVMEFQMVIKIMMSPNNLKKCPLKSCEYC